MPYDKEYQRAWRQAHKNYHKEWRANNPDYYKKWREEHPDYMKKWISANATDFHKTSNISNWRYKGIKHDDFDALYEKYISTNNCEECNVELVGGRDSANRRCLDHDHVTGEFRNVLCHVCNLRRH